MLVAMAPKVVAAWSVFSTTMYFKSNFSVQWLTIT